jgi:hypothetical protein
VKIKKGTPCFVSASGHNNFWYPVYNEYGLTYFEEDACDIKIKSWLCGQPNLRAVLVSAEYIKDLYGGASTIVWVENKHLKGI